MSTIKQYRIQFPNMKDVGTGETEMASTRWFDSMAEALASRWADVMGASVVTREHVRMTFKEYREAQNANR